MRTTGTDFGTDCAMRVHTKSMVLLLCLGLSPITSAPNILVNGSFEQLDDKGGPVAWSRYGKECERVILTDDSVAFEGEQSAKFLPIIATAVEGPCWSQAVACKPGEVYRLSGYFRCQDAVAGSLGMRLFWRNLKNEWIWENARGTRALSGTVGWTRLQTQGAAPPGSAYAVVELFGDTGDQAARGIVWCDAVQLERLVPSNDWDRFQSDPALQKLLPAFCWEYDRAVVAYAYLEDAARGLRRALYYESGGKATKVSSHLEGAVQSAWKDLTALRDRYRAVYPLIHGKPGNGWPLAYAEYRTAYKGNPNLFAELRQMTQAAATLLKEELATLRECCTELEHGRTKARIPKYKSQSLLSWRPDLTGRDPPTKRRLISSGGRVDRILFGGSHCIPGDRWRHNRLMQYDYEMQIYENLDWPKREAPQWNDEAILSPFAEHNLAVDMILSYSNHGFMYCPQWLWPEIAGDKEAFITERAAPNPGAPWRRFPFLNLLHPRVRDMQEEYVRLIGDHYKGSPDVLYYRGPWEANDAGPEWSHESAHDGYSMREFRAVLRRRYGSIEALNEQWGTRYATFEDLMPPPRSDSSPDQALSPLGYAFQAYRKDRFMDWWRHCYESLRRADASHPVATDPSAAGYNTDVNAAVDYYRLAETGDIVSLHWGDTPQWMFWYLYSLGRFTAKPLGVLEYVWNGPECWGDPPDEVAAAAGQRNLWQGTALGVKLYNFYGHNDTYVGFPATDQSSYNNLMDFETDYSLFRPCAGVVPLMHSKLNALRDGWLDAKVVPPQVGIYQPSMAANHPGTARTILQAAVAFEDMIYRENVPHATLFEQAVLDGKDTFRNYRVVCLPYAAVLPTIVSDKLVAWVKSGGLLLAAGPFGMWDTNARADCTAMQALLGHKPSQRSAGGEWILPGGGLLENVRIGKGSVLLSVDAHLRQHEEVSEAMRIALLAHTARPAGANNADLALITRDGRDGTRYVTLYNRDSKSEARGVVWVTGKWRMMTDLGIPGGWSVKVVKQEDRASIPVCLGPGEGTVLRLSK